MISITLESLKPSSLIWWIADNSVWLGACATKGKTASNTTNTANALACFRTIVLRPSFLNALLVWKFPGEAFAISGTPPARNRFHCHPGCLTLQVVRNGWVDRNKFRTDAFFSCMRRRLLYTANANS